MCLKSHMKCNINSLILVAVQGNNSRLFAVLIVKWSVTIENKVEHKLSLYSLSEIIKIVLPSHQWECLAMADNSTSVGDGRDCFNMWQQDGIYIIPDLSWIEATGVLRYIHRGNFWIT